MRLIITALAREIFRLLLRALLVDTAGVEPAPGKLSPVHAQIGGRNL